MTAHTIDSAFLRTLFRAPERADDKYSRGAVLLATGSAAYPGAAVLGALGAARSGSGIVRFAGAEAPEALVLSALPEVVVGGGFFHAAVVGSGWDASMASYVEVVAKECADNVRPLVVDAGALGGVREWAIGNPFVVATPHAGEAQKLLARLLGEQAPSRADIEADVTTHACLLAELLGATVVVKAASTAVATPGGEAWVWSAPASWGATAGAGDVLAGVIGSRLAALKAVIETPGADQIGLAVAGAIGLHGLAVALASGVLDSELESTGVPGKPIIATDIVSELPGVYGQLL